MSTVYRIQDSDGRGPWRPGFSHVWVEPRPDHDNLRPYFEEMGHLPAVPGHVAGCGCTTLDQLRRWFTESEYRTLRRLGYRAVEIPFAKVVAESETQCVFIRRNALSKMARPIHLYPDDPE